MNKTSRPLAVLAATVIAGILPAVAAAPARASVNGPEPINTWLSAVRPDSPAWINIFWTAGKKICHVKVTAAALYVDVTYPENTVDHTSFSQSDQLRAQHVDHTAIRVDAHYPESAFVPLVATITYDKCGRYPSEKTESFRLTLPVQK